MQRHHSLMNAYSDDDLLVDELSPRQRSLRIAVVTETYPPEVNGVARTLACVVEGLRGRNHEIQLIRPRQNTADGSAGVDSDATENTSFHEVLMRGLPIPRYPHLRMGVTSKKSLIRLWSKRRPDIVHIATEGPMGWVAMQAANQLKLPVCSDFRTNFHAYSKHYGIGWLHKPIMAYLRKFHNSTQCTMTPDAGLRDELVTYGFQNVAVVARGVDTALFDPAKRNPALRESWGVAPQDLVVVHVGRLAAEKNLDALILAFEAVRQVQPKAKLVLVGDGPARKELQARVPDAIFAGMRHGDDLAAHYASGDLFIFPSLTETYGNVTAEAMASGTPVLAYDYAAASQLIQSGVNGQLAHFDNVTEFVGMAQHLAEHPELLKALGTKARATALGTGWDRIIDVIESIYAALMAGEPVPLAKSQLDDDKGRGKAKGKIKRLVSGVVARAPK